MGAGKSLSARLSEPVTALAGASRIARRELLRWLPGLAGVGLGLASSGVQAELFPSHPVKLLVPFLPGGPTDIVARPLAQMLSIALAQQVVIDNKAGAGGAVAADAVAKAAADGYTLIMGTVGTHAINSSLFKNLPYDPLKDFVPLGLVASAPVVVVVPASSPYLTIADLVAAAKKAPGTMVFGSAGNGTPGHLTGELFARAVGIELQHAPYRGSAPAVADLMGAQIPLMFDPVQSVLAQVQAGRLRALAVSSKERSPVLPQVPTLGQSGLKDFEAEAWWAVFAPAKLPAPVAAVLRTEIARVVRSNEYRQKLGNLGVVPALLPIQAFDDFHRAEIVKWARAVANSGASVN